MKKLKFSLLNFVACLSFVILSNVFLSCKNTGDYPKYGQQDQTTKTVTDEDIQYVASCLEKLSCPEFNSIEEFNEWRRNQVYTFRRDSVIRNVSPERLARITEVVYNKYNKITPELIFREYIDSYKSVYRYMENNSQEDTIKIE